MPINMLARLKFIHKSPLQSFIYSTNIHWVPHSVSVHPQGCNHIPWSYRFGDLKKDRMEGRSYSKGSLNPQRMVFICVTILLEATLKYRLWVLISKTTLKGEKLKHSFTHPQIVIDVESNVPHLVPWTYTHIKEIREAWCHVWGPPL